MMAKQWADRPFSLVTETGVLHRKNYTLDHPAVSMAQQMALAHNVILRSMNASINQCLYVLPGTVEAHDFMKFNQSVFEVLKLHHDVEEEYMFQEIERLTGVPGLMDQNLQEHKDFQDGLGQFRKYVFGTSADNYDGQTLKALLEACGGTVEKHLHDKIPTLLNLQKYDASRVQVVANELGHFAQPAKI
jgi:hypothetical protein